MLWVKIKNSKTENDKIRVRRTKLDIGTRSKIGRKRRGERIKKA